MDFINYPFSLSGDGSVNKTPDGEDYYAQELAVLIKTVPGERSLVPDYGLEDAAFDEVSKSLLVSQANVYIPGIQLGDLIVNDLGNEFINLTIEYTSAYGEDGFEDIDDAEDDEDYYDEDFVEEINNYYEFNDATD